MLKNNLDKSVVKIYKKIYIAYDCNHHNYHHLKISFKIVNRVTIKLVLFVIWFIMLCNEKYNILDMFNV